MEQTAYYALVLGTGQAIEAHIESLGCLNDAVVILLADQSIDIVEELRW